MVTKVKMTRAYHAAAGALLFGAPAGKAVAAFIEVSLRQKDLLAVTPIVRGRA
ncbi:MAG: hypothetical protein H7Z19_02395 [Chitinophagaceae bacterium]|nr:hypothetical protein [Rubrivivax sp.]